MMKKYMPEKGFIFIAIVGEKKENAIIIKTNKELKITDVMEIELSKRESVLKIAQWMDQPNDYRFISVNYDEFALFTKSLEKFSYDFPRDYVRILKSRFWNLQSEILYRLKCPANLSLYQLSEIYGLTINTHPLMAECLQLVNLTNAYFFDDETTQNILQNGYEKALRDMYQKQSIEKLMGNALNKGFEVKMSHVLEEGRFVIQLDARKEDEVYTIQSMNLHYIFVELSLKLF